MKTRKVLLGLLLVLIANMTLAQTKEETEALKQFVAFCKIRIDIENAHNMTYTPLILKAIGVEGNVLQKDYVKTELEKVLTDDNIQNQFLTFFGGLTSDKTNMYYLLKPPYTDFTISDKDANILSNYILTNYPKHLVEHEIEEESEQKETEVYIYTPIDKKADFKGGNRALQKFIIENLQFPKIEDLDNRISSVRVMADFDVDSTGTLSNYEFRTDIGLTGVYNYQDIQELEGKYSKFYEEKVKELLEKMPKWQPAQADNQNIKTRTSFPVVFRYAE